MREILFRGKTEDGKWIEGGYFAYHDIIGREHVLILEETEGGFTYIQVDPETVCQSTGLTNKNGVKIWENDIVRWDDDDECISVIRYDAETAAFVIDHYGINGCLMEYGWDETVGGFGKIETNGFDDFCSLDFEVIGNIFNNPELMEGGVWNETDRC